MTDPRSADLERGMELVAKLHEEDQEPDDPQVRKVFDDLRSTLRVPIVNYLFRALAIYPTFLESAWFHLRPHLRTKAFELEADRLRAEALLEPIPDGRDLVAAAGEGLDQLRSFTGTIHYALPKLLLIANALDACLPRAEAEEPPRAEQGFHQGSGLLPLGVAEGTVSLPTLSPSEAPESVRRVFEEIKQRHHHPGVATYYRALGNWPEFLAAAWEKVKPFVDAPAFLARRERLIQRAEQVVRGWILPFEAGEMEGLGLSPRNEEDIRAVLAVFRLRIIPDLLLDVSLIRAALEGPGEAQHSRFSAAEAEAPREEGADLASP